MPVRNGREVTRKAQGNHGNMLLAQLKIGLLPSKGSRRIYGERTRKYRWNKVTGEGVVKWNNPSSGTAPDKISLHWVRLVEVSTVMVWPGSAPTSNSK